MKISTLFKKKPNYYIGIDLGGTNIVAAVVDENGVIDFKDGSVTENTRVSYPIDHIEKIVRPVSAAPCGARARA